MKFKPCATWFVMGLAVFYGVKPPWSILGFAMMVTTPLLWIFIRSVNKYVTTVYRQIYEALDKRHELHRQDLTRDYGLPPMVVRLVFRRWKGKDWIRSDELDKDRYHITTRGQANLGDKLGF